ncbi:MAG: CopG family transcriptional regulator [Arcanobacterium sp.]|nr:CopG family transcriptional regulator [Arcanobacterium sp.]
MTWTAANGTTYSEADLERWASAQEEGYTGGHLGAAKVGRPVSVGAEARPFTLRLDAARREKIAREAAIRHTTASGLLRDLIDAL